MNAGPNLAKAIFLEAVEQHAPEQWPAFLDTACAGQPELRGRVEALLAAHREVGTAGHGDGADGASPIATVDAQLIHEGPGTVIGPYKLLEQIGEGGFGIVFVAEQVQPVRRRVALKLLKPGLDTRQVVARFEAERQALALMDHPNIAQIHDGGTMPDGRPFFVMELVKGISITDYCDRCSLTTRERLELLLSVCHAVQHAHQKGVIHRDLKPSNVLVAIQDGQPAVKVIDFGIAKAINQRLSEQTLATGFHQMIGTPLYMSPEQAELSPLDVDTRADVYSLGVLLYELLTGTTPLEKERLSQAGYDELRRLIREEEPPTPSARLSTLQDKLTAVASQRRTDPRQLLRTVRGELDWIVMKCLEKDRNRRFETANSVASDIEHFLAGEPVLAHPPSAVYRLRKFAQRHKRALITAAVLGMVLLAAVGAVTGTIGWAVRDRAARQAARDQEVTGALAETEKAYRLDKLPEAFAAVRRAEGLLAGGDGGDKLRQWVFRWHDDLTMAKRLEDIRLQRAATRGEFANDAGTDPAYRAAFQEQGIDVLTLASDEAAARIRSSPIKRHLLAALDDWVLWQSPGQVAEQERLLSVARQADDDPWRNRLRDALQRKDKNAVLAVARDNGALTQPPATVVFLGSVLDRVHELPLAIEVLGNLQRQRPGDFWINQSLAQYLYESAAPNRRGEALSFQRVAVALRPDSGSAHGNLGLMLDELGRLTEAEAELRRAAALAPAWYGSHFNLGSDLAKQGKYDQAAGELREAVRLRPDSANIRVNLGIVLAHQGRLAEAESEYRQALRRDPTCGQAHLNIGNLRMASNRLAEAEDEYRKAVASLPNFAAGHYSLGNVLRLRGHSTEAEAALRKALALQPNFAEAHYVLALLLADRGKFAQALQVARDAVRFEPRHAKAHEFLAWLVTASPAVRLRDPKLGLAAAAKAVELQPQSASAWQALGHARYRAGQWKAAIEALTRSCDLSEDPQGGDPGQWLFLAMAHWQIGEKDKARAWYQKAAQWFEKNGPPKEEFRRFQAEAAALVGIDSQPRTKREPK